MSYVNVELPPITITTEDMRYLSVLGLSSTPSAARELTLPRAGDADGELNRVSVLTRLGAALIGLSVGQTIEFKTAKNEKHSLTILRVQD
jgi:regulator of nucleoside diphosphate kinase